MTLNACFLFPEQKVNVRRRLSNLGGKNARNERGEVENWKIRRAQRNRNTKREKTYKENR